jgi:hypothetical protein
MSNFERTITELELRRNTGERGTRKWTAKDVFTRPCVKVIGRLG